MADANDTKKASDDATQKTDATADKATSKTYSEEEFKKVVDERQAAKEKLRKIEETETKAREAKQIEDGKLKEVLAAKETELEILRKSKADYETQQAKIKELSLAKIKDESLRAIAAKLPLEDLQAFIEKFETSNRVGPDTSRGGHQPAEDSQRPKPGEPYQKWLERMRLSGMAQ